MRKLVMERLGNVWCDALEIEHDIARGTIGSLH